MNIKKELPGAKKNVPLANCTTFKIGGPARYFFIARSKEDLINAVMAAKKNKLPFFVFGKGSNLLISDKGFNGLVINIQDSRYKISPCGGSPAGRRDTKTQAAAGMLLKNLSKLATKLSLTGLEWAAGIPGTLGGAIYGNAQAFGRRMSDVIESVEVLDTRNLTIKKMPGSLCEFGIKASIFKKNKNLIILSVVLKLEKGNKEEINSKIKEFLKYRKSRHPKLPSAGSVFINRQIKIKNKKLLKEFPELAEFNKKGYIPSSYLIEKAGLKGKRIGGAEISDKHAGFILNVKKAKAKDVLELIKIIKKKVKEKFDVLLEEEIQIIK